MVEEYFCPGGFLDVMKRLNPKFAPFVTKWMAIIINGLVHVAGSIRAKGYSPGVATGVILYVPLSVYASVTFLSSGRLTAADVAVGLVLGLLYQAVPIGYLAMASALTRKHSRHHLGDPG